MPWPLVDKIYALECDSAGVFYIGRTLMPLDARLRAHRSAAKNPKTPVSRFMGSLKETVRIRLLQSVTGGTFRSGDHGHEARWIRMFESEGADLKNVQFSKNDMRRLRNRTPDSTSVVAAQSGA